jgi:AbrB family looped-hinge helix DNA binding protein
MVHLTLAPGRELWVSGGRPIFGGKELYLGRAVGDWLLVIGFCLAEWNIIHSRSWEFEAVPIRAKVSKKNQVALPSQLRRNLGIRPGDDVIFELRDGYALVMADAQDYADKLRGLHREIWTDTDPTEYLQRERKAWGT